MKKDNRTMKEMRVKDGKPGGFDTFSILDVVFMAIVAAIFGILAVYNLLITDYLRVALGLYGGLIVGGLFHVPGIIAFTVIKKKGAAFITQNLFGISQLMFGSPVGFLVLFFTGAESLGLELTFFLFKYPQKDKTYIWAIAGMVSTLFAQIPNYLVYGFGGMPWWSWVLPIIFVGVPSGAIFSILLTRAALHVIPKRFLQRQ